MLRKGLAGGDASPGGSSFEETVRPTLSSKARESFEIQAVLSRIAVDGGYLHASPSPFGVSPWARLSDAGCFAGDEYYFSLKFARE
jgi:hypothetical protein